MQEQYIILLLATFACCGFIIKGNRCSCNELFIESDCFLEDICAWNSVKMICESSPLGTNKRTMQIFSPQLETKSISYFCNQFDQRECQFSYSCSWTYNKCTFFSGCTPYLYDTNESCKNISTRCFTDGVSCVEIGECATYLNGNSCIVDQSGKYCYWNPVERTCQIARDCTQLPLTFTSDSQCRSYFSYCTAQVGGGCIESGFSCSNQVAEIACVTNRIQDQLCFWSDGKCKNKECENAPESLTTDEQCSQFSKNCTTKKDGGCIFKTICAYTQSEAACVKDLFGKDCFWTGAMCAERICKNAPNTYDSNEICRTINPKCITTGKGCVMNYVCSAAVNDELCMMDMEGNKCIWSGTQCMKKKCSMAPSKTICSEYMSTCIENHDSNGCIEKVCTDAPVSISSNDQCESFLPAKNCITKNGGGCRENTTCSDIDISTACLKNKFGNICYWDDINNNCATLTSCDCIQSSKFCIKDHKGLLCEWVISKNRGNCVNKSCSSAPSSLITEQQCLEYFTTQIGPSCTTKKGGGCQLKNQCQDAEVQEACTTNKDGVECFWDISTTKCRELQCSDIKKETFLLCNKKLANCTISINQDCEEMQPCRQIKNKEYCLKGSDGVCLWIDNYENYDSSYGACFQFDGCQSIKWKTDAECKMISINCTTDGQQCVPITDCANINVTGGCTQGTDGQCIQLVSALLSTAPIVCSKFINCQQAYYLTHLECQQANKLCTTNGITGCRGLTQCSEYNFKEACHINDTGVFQIEVGMKVSTGNCIWDETSQKCRDQQCSDINFNTQSQCEATLFNCTSDGTTCVEKGFCATSKKKQQCNLKIGLEGPCYWDQNQCKQKTCKQILNGMTFEICQEVKNCFSDGTKCISRANCNAFSSKVACSSSQAIDGICVWTSSTQQCELMQSCNQANKDQNACQQAEDRCVWIIENSQTKCVDHTCQTYQDQTGNCDYFQTFDQSQYQICKVQDGVCTSIDVHTLSESDCYVQSLYLYSWNPISNKCSQCSKIKTNVSVEVLHNNQTSYSQFEFVFAIVIGFLYVTAL